MSLPTSPSSSLVMDGQNRPVAKKAKLGGYDFYRSIGSPRYVVAPMVDQSELAWRMLSRAPLPSDMAGPSNTVTGSTGRVFPRHPGGAHLCYTPMINARSFAQSKAGARGQDLQYNTSIGEEGSAGTVAGIEGGDGPVFVQFCANDPEILLKAAKKVENHCDAVDINFGCPQGIARRGHYGSFLQDEWDLIKNLIGVLHENLAVPVTAKFRIHPNLERTIAYAKMMEAAGAQILTCHGRTREMKGQLTGLADWEIIRKVKEAVNIPVFANGNILYYEDVERCLEATGCDGVMTAEGNLFNPSIFLPPSHPHMHPPAILLARRYLDIVDALKTPTGGSAIKSHLFRVLKPILDAQPDESFRARIGKSRTVEQYREVLDELEALVKDEMEAAGSSWRAPPIDPATGYRKLPIWVAQPYIRSETVTITAAAASGDAHPEAVSASTTTPPAETGNASAVSAVLEPDTIPTAAGTPVPTAPTLTTTNAEATSSTVSAAAALNCSYASCKHIAANRCPHRACLTHCRSMQAVAASAAAAASDEAGERRPILAEEEAINLAQRGKLNGQGCEAHEEKVRARAEREKEKKHGRTARVNAAKEKHREHQAGKVNGSGKKGVKRQASIEADEGERSVPVPAAAAAEEEALLNSL